jgi:hypothetical protein
MQRLVAPHRKGPEQAQRILRLRYGGSGSRPRPAARAAPRRAASRARRGDSCGCRAHAGCCGRRWRRCPARRRGCRRHRQPLPIGTGSRPRARRDRRTRGSPARWGCPSAGASSRRAWGRAGCRRGCRAQGAPAHRDRCRRRALTYSRRLLFVRVPVCSSGPSLPGGPHGAIRDVP